MEKATICNIDWGKASCIVCAVCGACPGITFATALTGMSTF